MPAMAYKKRPKATYDAHRIAPTQSKLFDEPVPLDDPDDRWTPRDLVASLGIDFTVDVAASSKNTVCKRFFDVKADGLAQSWRGETVWCNPPYSNLRPWLEKAHAEMRHGCKTVVMLLPANRTEQAWWQEFVEPFRDGNDKAQRWAGCRITTHFIRGRVHFGNAGGESPPFGCVFVIFERAHRQGDRK